MVDIVWAVTTRDFLRIKHGRIFGEPPAVENSEYDVRCAASPEMRFHSFSGKSPALYLLHDEAAAPTDWLSMTSLERYTSERG